MGRRFVPLRLQQLNSVTVAAATAKLRTVAAATAKFCRKNASRKKKPRTVGMAPGLRVHLEEVSLVTAYRQI
jgi:hypothetical protein